MIRWGNLLLFSAVLSVCLGTMEAGVRLLRPQQLVRFYTLPDADMGTRLRPSARYHDLYGNDYWVRVN